jgi:hypothetical protein
MGHSERSDWVARRGPTCASLALVPRTAGGADVAVRRGSTPCLSERGYAVDSRILGPRCAEFGPLRKLCDSPSSYLET